jgi:formate-dependent phosphoribosylglycinamide formyltransferase (GAR transformylase)
MTHFSKKTAVESFLDFDQEVSFIFHLSLHHQKNTAPGSDQGERGSGADSWRKPGVFFFRNC